MTKEQDWVRFCELMNVVAELTNNKSKSEESMGIMFGMLSQYQFSTIEAALKKHLATNKFFPAIADIIEHIVIASKDKAFLAWQLVKKTVARVGKYNPVKFNDPCIHFAIHRLGGWDALCSRQEDEMTWIGKDFMEIYQLGLEKNISWNSPDIPEVFSARLQNSIIPAEIKYIGFKETPKALPDKQKEKEANESNPIVAQEIAKMMKKIVKDFDGENKGGK